MPRIRTIKPEFFTSLTIADLTPEQRLTFIGLWTHVDDEGRCVDEPRLIKAAIWPLDDRTAADIENDLTALRESSLITRYTSAGRAYLAVTNWREHQKISKPSKSKLPSPDEADDTPDSPLTSRNTDSGSVPGVLPESSRNAPRGKGKEQGTGNRERNGETPSSELATRDPDPATDRPDVDRLCAHLADRIERNGSQRPSITKAWRTAARLLLDKDGRTEEQVHAAIDWCQDSEFWRGNVLSMPKLRDKYDQLRLQAARQPAANVVPFRDRQQQHTDDLFDRAMQRARTRMTADTTPQQQELAP